MNRTVLDMLSEALGGLTELERADVDGVGYISRKRDFEMKPGMFLQVEGAQVAPRANGTYDVVEVFAVLAIAKSGRTTLHEVTVRLNARGYTFAQIGDRVGAHESTVSRWAKRSGATTDDSGEA